VLQRILLVVAILFVIWRIATAWGRRLVRTAPGADSFSRFSPFEHGKRRRRHAANPTEPEELVACATCGTYVPARRALTAAGGRSFCGEECRDASGLPASHGDRTV
jgi:hypothetical protein